MDNQQSKEIIENYFKPVKEFVRMVIKGHSDALVLLSDGGLGKSYQVLKTLEEEGLKQGKGYEYICVFSTPLELYHMLYANQNKLIVFDDVEGLLEDRKSIAILKAALWSNTNKRIVHYHSTTEKLRAPKEFEFKGKVILCLNDLVDCKIVNALISRCLYYRLILSYHQKIEIMKSIAEKEGIPQEIVEFIRINSSPATKNLNFRTLIHLWNAYRYDMNNGYTGNWKTLGKALLESDGNLSLVWELSKTGKKVEEQAKEFAAVANKSRRTYFRYKKLIENGVKMPLTI